MILITIELVLLSLASIGTLYYILSTIALIHHFRKQHSDKNFRPTVSFLKPVRGIDAGADINFRSFLNQDYPDYEVIFGVLDECDPVLPLLHRLADEFDNAEVHTGSDISGSNNKVRILQNLAQHAKGEILVIADSDTRISPDALRKIVAMFDDESVGVVTCPYRGIEAKSMADKLQALHMTCVFIPGVACASALGSEFGLGAMIAVRKSVLTEIGGFESITDYLADDFQLAHKAHKAGFKIKLADYVVDIVLAGEDLKAILERELRWSKTVRVSNPAGHFGLVFTFGFAFALLYLFVTVFSPLGWLVFASTTCIRFLTAYIGAQSLDDHCLLDRLHLLPIRDLLEFGVWIASCFGNTVRWRGRTLRLTKDGKIKPAGHS